MTLGALAIRHGCELQGDPALRVDHVAPLGHAGAGAVTFLANPSYREQLAGTAATAVILQPADAGACPVAALLTPNPYLVFARVAADLHPSPPVEPGVHPRAVIGPGCIVPASCGIAAGVVLEEGVALGEGVAIGPNSVIGRRARIGADTRIMAGVFIYRDVQIGERCVLHSGAVLGADGFGMARDSGGDWVKVPQLGSVRLGNDVEIGANTTIDRGAIGDTVICDGVKLDNQIQIGHNVVIGAHTAIAAMAGISGSTRIGARCMIGGKVGMAGHLTIADDVVLLAASMVFNSITQSGIYGGTLPADEVRRWRKNAARFGQLDSIARRLSALERHGGRSE